MALSSTAITRSIEQPMMLQLAKTAAIGSALPLYNKATADPAAPPMPNCTVPMMAEALPATLPLGAIANAVMFGKRNPVDPTVTNRIEIAAGNPPQPVHTCSTNTSDIAVFSA